MARLRLDAREIVDGDSLHDVFARELGFPGWYGRNGDAWIDCVSCLREDCGMTRFLLGPDEVLTLELAHSTDFRRRAPEIAEALEDWCGCVNERMRELGEEPVIALELA